MKIQVRGEWVSQLTKKLQIVQLNDQVRCTLRPSKVAGIGVFAIRYIRKGERFYCTPNLIPKFYDLTFTQLDGLVPEIKELILQRWASVVNQSLFMSPNDDAHLLMFINHSPNPAEVNYDVATDTALKDILKDTELFEDYRVMDNWEKVRPLNKNPWLNVINVEKVRSPRSLLVALLVKFRIRSFVRN